MVTGRRKPLRLSFADRLHLHQVFHTSQEALGDEDLTRSRLPTEAGGEVGDRSDGAVVEAPLEADGADGRVALGDAQSDVEVVAALLPAYGQPSHTVTDGDRHAERAEGRVWHGDRIIKEDHETIPRESLESSLMSRGYKFPFLHGIHAELP